MKAVQHKAQLLRGGLHHPAGKCVSEGVCFFLVCVTELSVSCSWNTGKPTVLQHCGGHLLQYNVNVEGTLLVGSMTTRGMKAHLRSSATLSLLTMHVMPNSFVNEGLHTPLHVSAMFTGRRHARLHITSILPAQALSYKNTFVHRSVQSCILVLHNYALSCTPC